MLRAIVADNKLLLLLIDGTQGGSGVKREIDLTRTAQIFPPQLHGRIDPGAWAALMADCELLAKDHPYMEVASAECCANNVMGCCVMLVIGFGCFQGELGLLISVGSPAHHAHVPVKVGSLLKCE